MRLARSVTTCSVAAPAGTITHATRGGRSARTNSSSAVVPVAPSLAIALTPAGSDAYPMISWPPRIRRRTMLAPIRPSPTIPICIAQLLLAALPQRFFDSRAQSREARGHVGAQVHAERAAAALRQNLEVAARLRGLHHPKRVRLPWHRQVSRVVT